MKKLSIFLVLIISTISLYGCDKAQPVVTKDLLHHRFVLIKADDQDIIPQKQAFVEFGEHLTVNGKMCNQFFGLATLDNGIIKSENLASTDMICSDDEQLNKLDSIISDLFKNGATVHLNKQEDKTYLQLKDNHHELTFELKDLM